MLPPGGRVLVALSGGPDSVALLHVLQTLERRGDLVVAGAAHFNHQLRGAEADADELFCRELAASLNLPIVVGRGDVRGMAGESGRSIEDAARTARYGFLNDAAASLDAGAIAVGHSLEDQAETFLLRLIRGAGPAGLAGVRPRAGIVIRPLLEIPRAELRAYAGSTACVSGRIPRTPTSAFRATGSASSCCRTWSSSRRRLPPSWRARRRSPGRTTNFWRPLQSNGPASIVLQEDNGVALDAAALAVLHPALASRVARTALQAAAPGRFIGFQHVDDLLDLTRRRGRVGGRIAGTGGECDRGPGSCSAAPRRIARLRTLSAFRCLFQVR